MSSDGGYSSPSSWGSIQLCDLSSYAAHLKPCYPSNLAADIIYQCVWALVLRHYLGTDEVSYQYSTSKGEIGSTQDLRTCTISAKGRTPLPELYRSIESSWDNGSFPSTSVHSSSLESVPQANTLETGIYYLKSDSNKEPAIILLNTVGPPSSTDGILNSQITVQCRSQDLLSWRVRQALVRV